MAQLKIQYSLLTLKQYWLLAVTFLWPVVASSQTYSLDDVLNKIEKYNPSLVAYQDRINAVIENAKGAKAWQPPKTGLELDMAPYNFDYYTQGSIRFYMMQDFPNPRRNKANENYMKSMSATEKYGGDFYKVELFAGAKETFYKIYVSKRRVVILNESNEALSLMIKLATKQMAITKGDLASIYRLKARLAENETMIIHEENMIRALRTNLNYLMNDDINQTFDIDTIGLAKNYRNSSSFIAIDSLDKMRSDLLKKNSEITTMRLNQQYVSLRSKPEFGARVTHNQRITNLPNTFSIMGTMTIPSAPWSANSYKSVTRAMDYQIAALEKDKANMRNMALQMIKMYLIELESEYKELDNYMLQIIPSYRKSLDANLLAYGQNTNDMTMTLIAWDDLLMAQIQYLKHLDTYFKIQTEYEKELQIR